ncbi:UDP-glucose 4-epimerase GalE [Ramlibacter sp.]|uniref:UDP-glucose 4-epimerase GalE n=1 Tax=Ramlibacter sp. TaxID=1917967 RepID=UPI0017A8EFF5|nr:UDP-glucose 4-epimerase GalE [Ramlibacter sp.]MBA2676531.1 UDP-glucose 4-epimerase GalE [Ramlibacter sp.]
MTLPSVIVAGGAGYIGSHMVRMLQENGYQAVVVDNLATGHADAVRLGAVLREGDIGDPDFMRALLREHRPQCVMHFAAASLVGESMVKPAKYWRNNLVQTLNLLDAMRECEVKQFIFSSTAAVYGNPVEVPITEQHPQLPINPYGNSKLAVEKALQDYGTAYGLRSITLRYFNAAGAHPDGTLGERHEPETHLIPLVLQVASGRREVIGRFGQDFPTRDGSCIRDYIHVQDLCSAHLLALQKLEQGAATTVYNLGNGNGHSVNEVIEAARRVTGHPIPVRDDPRRAGDPPVLVADATRARKELGWTPQHADIETVIAHAWQWEQKGMNAR